jgi:predicted nucleic acid-binding Zn ribbon protein
VEQQQSGQQAGSAPERAAEGAGRGTGCPQCGEPIPAGARFCEECGYEFEPGLAPNGTQAGVSSEEGDEPERPTAIWWLIAIIWVVLIVGGLLWLFRSAITL